MVIAHLRDGTTRQLDPQVESDLRSLDYPSTQRKISRLAFMDSNGKRVDLPHNNKLCIGLLAELLTEGDVIKGEVVSMIYRKFVLRFTLYYSDSRVVVDVDQM